MRAREHAVPGRFLGLAAGATAVLAGIAGAGMLAGVAVAATAPSPGRTPTHALLSSRNLWATVDVCGPPKQRYTVGIRGSMPSDGEAGDRMFMSFRLQQLLPATGRWRNFGPAGEYELVGNAIAIRQGGTSFEVRSGRGQKLLTLRGLVMFQWRQSGRVIAQAQRYTTTGHESLAGADPPHFSAATCALT
jgi:hypothetical protein